MYVIFAVLLILVLLACWLLTLVGTAGQLADGGGHRRLRLAGAGAVQSGTGLEDGGGLAGAGGMGEVVEILAAALGVARAGGTRRGVLMALGGSLVGGVLGILVGLPIPLVGSVVAAVLFAALGAMAGAVLGEVSAGRGAGELADRQAGFLGPAGRHAGQAHPRNGDRRGAGGPGAVGRSAWIIRTPRCKRRIAHRRNPKR